MSGKKYPAQSNIQTSYNMRDEIDAVAQLSETSRAEIMRDCFEEALHTVMTRRRVGVAKMRKLAADIAYRRDAQAAHDAS